MKISSDSIVVAARKQVSADLGGEAAILHLDSGLYYGLDQVGARIWAFIQRPRRMGEILEMLLERYDVNPTQCEEDLRMLLKQLSAEKLIEIEKR